MTLNEETRRTGKCGRASNVSLGSDTFDLAQQTPVFNRQAARIARRFAVSDAVARMIAEHAYAVSPAR